MAKKPIVRKPIKHKGGEYDGPDVEKFSHTKKKGKHKRGKASPKD